MNTNTLVAVSGIIFAIVVFAVWLSIKKAASTVVANSVACPKCGSSAIKRIGFTWWGGALGPRLLNHVKCNTCGATYNGKTGESNTIGIAIYTIVVFIIAIVVLVALTNMRIF